ncbi:SPOR domain-containing protein [Neptuniibacter sp. QD57_21]|uniref:SPOR domain-containing protein n=1 Tax=Neptuniibacter sp. QD57_21 TaxID=3398213 RepID=UPI0039F44E59
MSLILNNKVLLHAMVGVSALLLLTGCSQKRHSFCHEDTSHCEPPSPPSLSTSSNEPTKTDSTELVIKASYSNDQLQGAASKRPVQVIETLRNQPNKVINNPAQVIFTKRVSQSNTTIGSYTIQLGAYKLESSRQTVIKRFKNPQPLNQFSMPNGLLGLSYGLYLSKAEALEMAQSLKHQGFNDLLIRRTP